MKRIVLLLTVALVMAAILAVSAPNAFAAGKKYGWGANNCHPDSFEVVGPGCGYHWGQS